MVFSRCADTQLEAADQAAVWTAPCMKRITGFVASVGALQAEVLVPQMQLMLNWTSSRKLLIWTSKLLNYSSSGVRGEYCAVLCICDILKAALINHSPQFPLSVLCGVNNVSLSPYFQSVTYMISFLGSYSSSPQTLEPKLIPI
jgi:hypothetical protein